LKFTCSLTQGQAIASIPTTSSSLNSLFRVLCIFRSRYLCSIGLPLIFSLGRSIPPALGCTVKQPDSPTPASSPFLFGPSVPAPACPPNHYGGLTLFACPLPRDLWFCCLGSALAGAPHYISVRLYVPASPILAWALPSSLAATRGITVVFFSSAY